MRAMQQEMPTTPILDSGTLPPPRPKKRALGIVLGMVVGVVFGVTIGALGAAGSSPGFVLFIYFAALALVVTMHEIGHVVAGWLVGFHFTQIAVGPLWLKIEYGRLRLQMRRDLGVLGYAGMYLDTVKRARRRLLVFIAAGPTANLISATIVALTIHVAPSHWQHTRFMSFLAGVLVLSLITACMSLIPYGPTLKSDGSRIRMLLTSRAGSRRWITAVALGSEQRKGIRPRDWKRTWLTAACSVRDGAVDELSSNLVAYIAACDRRDVATSAAHLERCLELAAIPQTRDFLAREASYYWAWFHNDSALGEQWLSQVKRPKLATELARIRTDITMESARRNFESAIVGWRKGMEFIDALPATKIKPMLEESWREWGNEILEKQEASVRITTHT